MINLDACELGDVSEQDRLRSKKRQIVVSPNRMREPTNEPRRLLPQNPKWLVPKKKFGKTTLAVKNIHEKSGPVELDESFPLQTPPGLLPRVLKLSPLIKSKLK